MAYLTTFARIRDWLRVELHCGIALLPQKFVQLCQSKYPSRPGCQIWIIPLVRTTELRNLVIVQTILLATPPCRSQSLLLKLFRLSQEPKAPVLISRSTPVTWFPMIVTPNYQGALSTFGPVPFDRQSRVIGIMFYIPRYAVSLPFRKIDYLGHSQTVVYDLFKRMLGSGPTYVALGNHDSYHTWVFFAYLVAQRLQRISVRKMPPTL